MGGSPRRVLRLSPTGLRCLNDLLAGDVLPGSSALRERLRDARMLLVEPQAGTPQDVVVVLPIKGTAAEAQVVLDGVPPGTRLVVVDAGSPHPLRLPGAQVLRRATSAGAAAARNTGAARTEARLIAFVDAGMRLPEGWLDRLTGHFADPQVVAVAPRVRSGPAPGLAGILEQQLSALDLGPVAGEVGPGLRLSYLPSAVLLVRRAAFERIGGFDERMAVGEDVDLIWRLCRQGVVRYDPEVEVVHDARQSVRAVLLRRRDYGTSAGLLDLRHPGQLRHLELSPWQALPWAAAALHPAAALVALGYMLAAAPRALPVLPGSEAQLLVAQGQLAGATGIGRFLVRPGLPALLAAAAVSPRVRGALPLMAAGYAWSVRPDMAGGPLRMLARVLDDIAYTSGVWQGCLSSRRWRPIVPALRLRSKDHRGVTTRAQLP